MSIAFSEEFESTPLIPPTLTPQDAGETSLRPILAHALRLAQRFFVPGHNGKGQILWAAGG